MSDLKPENQLPMAVVTGAAHRLGRAIAVELARQGYAIGLHYHRSVQQAERTAEEIRSIGAPVVMLPGNLADPRQVVDVFARTAETPYPLRVLVNSAAVMARGDLRQMTVEEWDATLALNLRAPWLCAREAAGRMQPGGVIINISDAGAGRAWTSFPAYAISKAALETLTRLLARTLAPDIRVNAVAPGLILPAEDMAEADWQRLVRRLPLGRPGAVEEISQAVVFLAQNAYITGQTLVVDGGYQLA